jgi:L-rhamnose mutarotase
MTRYATIIGLKPEAEAKYKELHKAVWPGVLETIKKCNISNYSIYLYDHKLFAYLEYNGTDYAVDMAKMAADKTTQEWWVLTDAMQIPLPGHKEGELWAPMEEVFHID